MISYQALFTPEDEWFIITFPDFGWGVSNGKGEEDSLSMARDLLLTLVRGEILEGRALPVARKYRGRAYRTITLSALDSAKIELYQAIRASGLSKGKLATRLGISEAELNRLLDLRYKSRFNQIEAAFRALGKRVVVTVEDAA
jgi:antitoxin HicB